jgi:two-component system, NarL family, response regulator NreC
MDEPAWSATPGKEMGKIRILVASDYQMVRSGLRLLLKTEEAFDVLLTEADVGKALPRLCQTLSPDVLVVAFATNGPSSLRVVVNVLTTVPRARIIIVGASESTTYVRAVLATGVLGYIFKAAAQSELFQAIKHVHRGRRFIDPRLQPSLPDHLIRPANELKRQSSKQLSRREIEVLRSISLGFTTKEISKELDLSQKTVQTYRERMYKKLALHTRADLVHYALAHGLAGWDKPV